MKDAARFFKVLSDESRLKILWLLLNRGELCVCDIMAVLEITQSKASRHLAALRHIGIAADRRDGLWAYYSLCPVEDELARDHLELLRTTLANQPDSKRLLKRLDSWLKAKTRGEICVTAGGRLSSKNKSKSGPKRTSRAGATR